VIGHTVGKYRLIDQIGEGGMGTVFRAEHTVLGSPAAVKLLLPRFTQDTAVVERFFQEAKAASAIRHPGVVEVFDYGRLASGQAYIAMELLRGEDLRGFLARHGRLGPELAAHIARQMLDALNATHAVGVIHRDLKPDNVFLVRDVASPGAVRVKILDFGIAKLVGGRRDRPSAPRFQTKGDLILGTPAYMAPEQCKGGHELDARVDVYALGCILFQMLTGRPPFVAGGDGEVMAMHIYEPPPRLSNLVHGLPVELDALLARLLIKDPADRIPSAAYALAELDRASIAPVAGEIPLADGGGALETIGLGQLARAVGAAPGGLAEPFELAPERWRPAAVLGGAVAIAIALAVLIGVT
jgi:eukaryotic-like serine/threonine-protein kinase